MFHDLVGFASDLKPKFVKQYADIGRDIRAAVARYAEEVRARRFPGPEHTFSMADGVVERLYGEMVR